MERTDGRTSALEDRTVESIQFEKQRENRPKENEQSLRHQWDYNKRSNCDIGVLEGKEKEAVLKEC